MTLKLEIDDRLNSLLQNEAETQGLSVEDFLLELAQSHLADKTSYNNEAEYVLAKNSDFISGWPSNL